MVFDRPPVLPRVFDELGLEVPRSFRDGIGRAAKLFQGEKEKPKPKAPEPEEPFPEYGAMTPAGTPPGTPPRTPPGTPPESNAMKEAIRNLRAGVDIDIITRGGYGRKSLSEKEKAELRAMSPTSPVYRPANGEPPTIGGTRKAKMKKKQTRKIKTEDLAKLFSKIWKSKI
jgi:hypothetical protein